MLIAQLPEPVFVRTLSGKTINAAAKMRRLLQESLANFSKRNPTLKTTQMDIVRKCQILEKYIRPFIYQQHMMNIAIKYHDLTPIVLKRLAQEKTEKTIAKMSY